MNRKGSIMDTMFLVIVLFTVVISGVLVVYSYNQISDKLSNELSEDSLEAVQKVESSLDFLDYFFLIVFIGLFIAMIVLAFMIRTHPALFVVFIILLILTVVISSTISNAYYEFSVTDTIASTISTKFPITDWIMRNLPIEIAVFGIILLIIMYSKTQSGVPA